MLENQIDQAERLATLENDRKLREQQRGSTFHQHAQAQADEINQGRFRATGVPNVIGSTPSPASQYPAAGGHQHDPVPAEPVLGYDINALESSASLPAAEVTGEPMSEADARSFIAPPRGDAQRGDGVGSSSSTDGEPDA
jgi:hypothetical protein